MNPRVLAMDETSRNDVETQTGEKERLIETLTRSVEKRESETQTTLEIYPNHRELAPTTTDNNPNNGHSTSDEDEDEDEDDRSSTSSSDSSRERNNNSIMCRICHCEETSEEYLIAPCYCSGTLRYVHQSCLQQWLKSKYKGR